MRTYRDANVAHSGFPGHPEMAIKVDAAVVVELDAFIAEALLHDVWCGEMPFSC